MKKDKKSFIEKRAAQLEAQYNAMLDRAFLDGFIVGKIGLEKFYSLDEETINKKRHFYNKKLTKALDKMTEGGTNE